MKKTLIAVLFLTMVCSFIFAAGTITVKAVPYSFEINKSTGKKLGGIGSNLEYNYSFKNGYLATGVEADIMMYSNGESKQNEVGALVRFSTNVPSKKKDLLFKATAKVGTTYIATYSTQILTPTIGAELGIDFMFADRLQICAAVDGQLSFHKTSSDNDLFARITPQIGLTFVL